MYELEHPVRAVFLTDEAGTITTWNTGCTELFGLAADAILGRSITSLFTPSGRDAWSAAWGALATRPEGAELQLDLQCAGGGVGPGRLTLAPQFDAGGALRGCAVAAAMSTDHDMTDAERVARTPLSAIVEMFPGTFYALNRDGRFLLWNHNLERVTEMTPDELAATRAPDLLDVAQRPQLFGAIRHVLEQGEEMKLEVDYVSKSGRTLPVVLCGTRVHCEGNDYLFGMGIDISEQRVREQQLRLRERALHATNNGIVITRCEGGKNVIEYVNPGFERITGYSAQDAIGQDPRFMAAPGMDAAERAQLREAVAARAPANVVVRNLRKNGDLFWNDLSITPVQDEHGVVTHYIGVLNDVTVARQRTAHLEHEVNHDSLTGLANRNLLWDRLEHALHLAQRQKNLVATVLLDLDNFKSINDTFGHEAGDVVLKVVARRLLASVRDSDTVARMSGDEFVLVLVNQPSLRFTLRMVERLRQSFAIPVSFGGQEIPVGASVGVSLYPHDGNTAQELVRAADVAMYYGKSKGRNDVHFFSVDMKSGSEAKRHIETSLHDALEHDELFLLYQPRVSVRSGQVTGFEALLRWRHPEQGVLPPSRFLADAEENGMIVQIGQRVLDQACVFAVRLRELGFDKLPVAVNVSQREFSQPGFVASLAERLERYRLPGGSLQLDLRLECLIRNPALGRDLADALHSLGVALSVDGFGTGLCDLHYLQQLSATQVKLSHTAVHEITVKGGEVTKSLIDIGHNLNMEVIGEAVETRVQMEFLRSNGCDQLQGIWVSEPLAAEAAQQLLSERQPA